MVFGRFATLADGSKTVSGAGLFDAIGVVVDVLVVVEVGGIGSASTFTAFFFFFFFGFRDGETVTTGVVDDPAVEVILILSLLLPLPLEAKMSSISDMAVSRDSGPAIPVHAEAC